MSMNEFVEKVARHQTGMNCRNPAVELSKKRERTRGEEESKGRKEVGLGKEEPGKLAQVPSQGPTTPGWPRRAWGMDVSKSWTKGKVN